MLPIVVLQKLDRPSHVQIYERRGSGDLLTCPSVYSEGMGVDMSGNMQFWR
jgi:hypothetical protein